MAKTKSKTQQYYDSHPEARKKKQEYDKAWQKKNRTKYLKSRRERAKARRKAEKKGKNIKGKDASHTKRGIVFKKSSVNRGSKSDSAGDKRARGKKRKSKK